MTTSNAQDAEILRQFIQRSGASPKAQVQAVEALERIESERDAWHGSAIAMRSARDECSKEIDCLTAAIARKDEALRAISELWPHDNCAKMARLALSETEGTEPCLPASKAE